MGKDLVEIEPRELQFPFELKKQSTCSIYLVNKSNDYVAFKVKTTSPKKYCVRPNTGVILPLSSSSFTVTMQAQKSAPPDMQLKDKFLVQTTVVPFGTNEEDILSDFFSKESGRYIEESKLRVVLISPPNSPEHPVTNNHTTNGNGSINPIPVYYQQQDPHPLKESSPKMEYSIPSPLKESSPKREYSIPSPLKESSPKNEFHNSSNLRESSPKNEIYNSSNLRGSSPKNESYNSSPLKESSSLLFKMEYSNPSPLKESSPIIAKESRVENSQISHVITEDVENLKSKVNNLEFKLQEAEKMIVKLRDESKTTIHERDSLQNEMVFLRKKNGSKNNQVGFPFLFVVYMVIVGMAFGYFLHA